MTDDVAAVPGPPAYPMCRECGCAISSTGGNHKLGCSWPTSEPPPNDDAPAAVQFALTSCDRPDCTAHRRECEVQLAALTAAGYGVIRLRSVEDCDDPWVCCIHERPAR